MKRLIAWGMTFLLTLTLTLAWHPLTAQQSPQPPEDWQLKGLLAALDDPDKEVWVKALNKLDDFDLSPPVEIPKEKVKQIAGLLDEEEADYKRAAVKALGKMGDNAKAYLPQMAELLEHSDYRVRGAAVGALGKMGDNAKAYLPQIVKLLEHSDYSVRRAAVGALGEMGDNSNPYLPQIAKLLEDSDIYVFQAAVETLGKMGDNAKPYLPQIAKLLEHSDSYVLWATVGALGKMEDNAKPYLPQIAKLLEHSDSDVREAAIEALGKMGENAKPYLPQMAKLLEHSDSDVRGAAVLALGEMGENAKPYLPQMVKLLEDSESSVRWAAVEGLGKMGEDAKPYLPQMVKLLEDSESSVRWAATEAIPKIATPIEIPIILHALNHIYKNYSAVVDHRYFAYYLSGGQADNLTLIRWNPWVRRITGLVYVGFLLTWIPFLRKRLFAPFKVSLLADADLKSFHPDDYFPNSNVKIEHTNEIKPLPQAIPTIKGQIILQGESGLGKSMFMRQLAQQSQRILVYLRADRCTQGVSEAIQKKLHGQAKDPDFLRNLIYCGAIDICIDGLNEVNADTRAKITEFVASYFKGNIIMTTQPLEWRPPATADTYILQPLEDNQIEAFLLSRQPDLSPLTPLNQGGNTAPINNNNTVGAQGLRPEELSPLTPLKKGGNTAP